MLLCARYVQMDLLWFLPCHHRTYLLRVALTLHQQLRLDSQLINIVYIQDHHHRRATYRLRAAKVHLWRFISEHDKCIALSDLAVSNLSIWSRHPHWLLLSRSKSILAEFYDCSRIIAAEVASECRIVLGDKFDLVIRLSGSCAH